MSKEKSVRRSFLLPSDLYDAMVKFADENKVSVNDMAVQMLLTAWENGFPVLGKTHRPVGEFKIPADESKN